MVADGSPEKVWNGTAQDAEARADLIESIILLLDPRMRAAFEPLLMGVLGKDETPGPVRVAALEALPLMGADYAGQSFAMIAEHLRNARDVVSAARAVTQLPRRAWDGGQARPIAEAILAWAKTAPPAQRTEQEFAETVQVGNEMAGYLPAEESARIRQQFLSLAVPVAVVKTVREQMRYDTTRLVVEAGKPFQIIFENLDLMPHNLVVVEPGAREEVGLQAQTMPPAPDRQGHVYVPKNKKIIAASRLLEAGQREILHLTAPPKTGTYEYLCTYPEHYKTMFGELVVVRDLSAFVTANQPLPPPPHVETGSMAHHHAAFQ